MRSSWKYYENGAVVSDVTTVSVREGKLSKVITPDLRLLKELVPGAKGKKRLVFRVSHRATEGEGIRRELEAPDGRRFPIDIESEDGGTLTCILTGPGVRSEAGAPEQRTP